jgi:hypothetical protein
VSARTSGPMTAKQRARAELVDRVKELARPLAVYWLFLLVMFGAFSVAALLDDPSTEGMMFLAFFGLVTVSSVGLGQVLALLRVRDWVLFALWGAIWAGGMFFGILGAMSIGAAAGPLMILFFIYVFLGPMFMVAGAYSIRVGRAIFGAWVPLMYASGTAIIMAENSGRVAEWHAGNKWAVWDVFTFGILGLGIVLLLAFLVTRESHRLHLWRRSPRGMGRGSVKETGAARPRLSCMGWALLAFLAVGLSVGTAAMAPYLWRTGPGDRDGDNTHDGDPQDGDPQDPKDGQQGDSAKDKAERQVESVGEEMQRNMQPVTEQGLDLLSTLLIMLLLWILALLVFWRPVRRLLTVRHLRDPFWTVSATKRIENGWRMVEIAMGDAGVPPRPGEPAVSLVLRAGPMLRKLKAGKVDVHGLEDAARVRDRIAYGLGVGPEDVALMNHVADWAYDTVWDRLGDRGQLKSMYRGIG